MTGLFSEQFGWWLLCIAVIGDFAVPFLLAPFCKGYRHRKQVMSELGSRQSPVRFLYNTWLVLLGLLLAGGCFALFEKFHAVSLPLSVAVVVLTLVFAVGAGVLAGLFSVGESKQIQTAASKIHGVGSSLGFMALLFVPLLLAILFFRMENFVGGVVCAVSFGCGLVAFTLFVMGDKPRFQNTVIAEEGLWQRLTLAFLYIPFVYVAVTAFL